MISHNLITHNGISHKKSNTVEQYNQSTNETQDNLNIGDTNYPSLIPESNTTVEQPTLEVIPKTSTKTETPIASKLETATLFTGLGESIFILLIACPFILLGFKKWLHN